MHLLERTLSTQPLSLSQFVVPGTSPSIHLKFGLFESKFAKEEIACPVAFTHLTTVI